ncbi:13064_t:CDS:2 [Racocetra fulgida]|uniref:13064_t:CDS:1 n=1 Tax=Racocetra fulgida TaxID=60492 RepID=A0A9N9FHD6_9GLOM|nr:13064_t:CDS:2 [Racocetra fulgida]
MLNENTKQISTTQQTKKLFYDDIEFFYDAPRPNNFKGKEKSKETEERKKTKVVSETERSMKKS